MQLDTLLSKQEDKVEFSERIESLSIRDVKDRIKKTKKLMNSSAISMNFLDAAKYRDQIIILQKRLKSIN